MGDARESSQLAVFYEENMGAVEGCFHCWHSCKAWDLRCLEKSDAVMGHGEVFRVDGVACVGLQRENGAMMTLICA